MNNGLIYCAPLSKSIRITTHITNALLIGISIAFILLGYLEIRNGRATGWLLIISFVTVFPIMFLASLWAPKSYRIGDKEIIVHKRIGDEKLPFDNIQNIEIWDSKEVFNLTTRVFGSGGYYGVFGSFCGGALSSFRALVTNDGLLIVLRMKKGEPVVISPETPNDFASELSRYSGAPMMEKDIPQVERPPIPPFSLALKILEAISLALLLFSIVIIIYYWQKLPQTIPMHFGASGAPDGWGPRSAIWIAPAISVFMYTLLTAITVITPRVGSYKSPQLINMLRWIMGTVKCFLVGMSAFIIWKTILTAFGKAQGLGDGFTIAILLIVFIGEPVMLITIALYNAKYQNS